MHNICKNWQINDSWFYEWLDSWPWVHGSDPVVVDPLLDSKCYQLYLACPISHRLTHRPVTQVGGKKHKKGLPTLKYI